MPRRETVLATIVRLLDTTFVRIGNEEYARENKSFGLTTLRNRHAAVSGDRLRLRFRGKSGKEHEVALDDPRVARVVRRCQAMPGQELFQYVDEDGAVRGVGSADVNDYIRDAAGADFTAKDFRTWHGTAHALALWIEHGGADGEPRPQREGAARRGRASGSATRSRSAGSRTSIRACSRRWRSEVERRAARGARQGHAPRRPERRRAPPARVPGATPERPALAKPLAPAYTISYRSVDDVLSPRPGEETPLEEPLVRVSDSGSVRTLALNRPQALNSFTGAMHGELRAALDAAAGDRDGALRRRHRHRPGLLRRPGSRRSGGRAEPRGRRHRHRRRRGDRALLQAARAAHPLDAGAGRRRGQRRRRRRRRELRAAAATSSSPRARRASSRRSRRSAWSPIAAAPGCCRAWSAAPTRWAWRCSATSSAPRTRSGSA